MTLVGTYLIVRKRSHISLHYHPLSLYSTSTLEEELANWVTFIDVKKIKKNNNKMAPTTKTAYVTGQYNYMHLLQMARPFLNPLRKKKTKASQPVNYLTDG